MRELPARVVLICPPIDGYLCSWYSAFLAVPRFGAQALDLSIVAPYQPVGRLNSIIDTFRHIVYVWTDAMRNQSIGVFLGVHCYRSLKYRDNVHAHR